jgi:hypothetical protein
MRSAHCARKALSYLTSTASSNKERERREMKVFEQEEDASSSEDDDEEGEDVEGASQRKAMTERDERARKIHCH